MLPRGHGVPMPHSRGTILVDPQDPKDPHTTLKLLSPVEGLGRDGFLDAASSIFQGSVNTWSAGFLDKLYASTDAPGVAAELILASLNTNAYIYAVAPALTLVEKHVTNALAKLFGLTYLHAGGVSLPGGAASNMTSLLVARNVMFPVTKTEGLAALREPLAIFVSAEAHFSVPAAARTLGLGSSSVHYIPVDSDGAMSPSALDEAIQATRAQGRRPFYVCATAGTTVRGAYDPLPAIADICARHRLWLHVDACWGGPVIFSSRHQHKLAGSARAHSIAVNPHKMLGVPLTCSFLLSADLRAFSSANKLTDAGYLFHNAPPASSEPSAAATVNGTGHTIADLAKPGLLDAEPASADVFDLASLTPQCGRRADSLKFHLAWVYHGSAGSAGFAAMVDRALAAAAYLAQRLRARPDVQVLGVGDPPCAQVCFWYVGGRGDDARASIAEGDDAKWATRRSLRDVRWATGEMQSVYSRVTRAIVRGLVTRGWMIDFAPGIKGPNGEERGEMMRAVMNRSSGKALVDGLVKAIREVGTEVVEQEMEVLESQGKV